MQLERDELREREADTNRLEARIDELTVELVRATAREELWRDSHRALVERDADRAAKAFR